jgi:sRNA-binding regulator protein Hfq
MIIIDKNTYEKKLRPSYGKKGRYQFPEGVLQEGNEIMLALHEGEIIRGKIVWYTNYDIFLQMGKKHLWIFRHSVIDSAMTSKTFKTTT